MIELHALFYGNVQGVGFRYKTQKIAFKYKINGFVRNLKDGSVELVIQGSQGQLNEIINQIYKDIGSENILSLTKSYQTPIQLFTQFEIH